MRIGIVLVGHHQPIQVLCAIRTRKAVRVGKVYIDGLRNLPDTAQQVERRIRYTEFLLDTERGFMDRCDHQIVLSQLSHQLATTVRRFVLVALEHIDGRVPAKRLLETGTAVGSDHQRRYAQRVEPIDRESLVVAQHGKCTTEEFAAQLASGRSCEFAADVLHRNERAPVQPRPFLRAQHLQTTRFDHRAFDLSTVHRHADALDGLHRVLREEQYIVACKQRTQFDLAGLI